MKNIEPRKTPPVRALSLNLVVPELRVADVGFNLARIGEALRELPVNPNGPTIALFPELSLTGFTCGDLFFQPTLLESALRSLDLLADLTRTLGVISVVGLPLQLQGALYDAAAVSGPTGLMGFSICAHPRAASGSAPSRHFSQASEARPLPHVPGYPDAPVGVNQVFQFGNWLSFQVVVGDARGIRPDPSTAILLNPCALPARAEMGFPQTLDRETQAALGSAALAVCSCGPTESTTDQVFSGAVAVWQAGKCLTSISHPSLKTQILSLPLELKTAREDALSAGFPGCADESEETANPRPFLPTRQAELFYARALEIQALGLAARLRHTDSSSVLVGLSGGADSSLALLVCCRAFDLLSLPRENILAVSMPGPGSSAASGERARALAVLAGASFESIPIHDALTSHLADIHHPSDQFDTTYENAQARERTQILMDLSNARRALAVGTGDLSEIALGWCTYNGDHMSMYHVNAGIPKTLVLEELIWAAGSLLGEDGSQLARTIVAAPISPELLPVDAANGVSQTTEGSIGPYLLHDFFLFHAIGQRCRPKDVLKKAKIAFKGQFALAEIALWLKVFYQRFFASQFKRSASPDGPQVLPIGLSPRGGWEMPSDASAALWLAELEGCLKDETHE